jgi:hypothetical protein
LAPAANPDFLFGKLCGQATHSFLYYPRNRSFGKANRLGFGGEENGEP